MPPPTWKLIWATPTNARKADTLRLANDRFATLLPPPDPSVGLSRRPYREAPSLLTLLRRVSGAINRNVGDTSTLLFRLAGKPVALTLSLRMEQHMKNPGFWNAFITFPQQIELSKRWRTKPAYPDPCLPSSSTKQSARHHICI
jgi:hypothetical protein